MYLNAHYSMIPIESASSSEDPLRIALDLLVGTFHPSLLLVSSAVFGLSLLSSTAPDLRLLVSHALSVAYLIPCPLSTRHLFSLECRCFRTLVLVPLSHSLGIVSVPSFAHLLIPHWLFVGLFKGANRPL